MTRVIDGDTLELSNGEIVRLIGIDCEENEYSPAEAAYLNQGKKWERGPDSLERAKKAKDFTRQLVVTGETKSISPIPEVQGTEYDEELLTPLPGNPALSSHIESTTSFEGKPVILEYDAQKKDEYGRTLAYVFYEIVPYSHIKEIKQPPEGYEMVTRVNEQGYDGTFVFLNATLIKSGYAQALVLSPNVKYQGLFAKLEKEAREQRRGLWKREIV